MFVKRNTSKQGGREYNSTLLVQGERVPVARPPGRPPKGAKRATKVVHRPLANLSKLPPDLIALIECYCAAQRKGEVLDVVAEHVEIGMGPAYGQLAVLLQLAREMGIERALGTSREARLSLLLVLARVIHRGSRLSTVRWAKTQAVAPLLGLDCFDEDSLYAALDWLDGQQERVEKALTPRRGQGAVFLYDVSSSYLEGHHNELAAPGYSRDGKRFKKQIVFGLLTDDQGEPISVQVYEGNRADPSTVADQVTKLCERFGAKEAVLVGDRGMLKAKGKELLQENGFRYITALTDAQIRTQLRKGTLQLELFDEQVTEVCSPEGERFVLRRNGASLDRDRARRQDQLRRVQAKVAARNAKVAESGNCSRESSLRQAEKWLNSYKLQRFVSARLECDEVCLEIDASRRSEVELLDGCYVVVTDVPKAVADAETIWQRYGALQQVERDFRNMKTGLLELRPIFLRLAGRTRAHALITILALKLVRELARRMKPLGLTCEDALDRLEGVRLVTLADPKLGLWRLPTKWQPEIQEVLNAFQPIGPPSLSLA
jgi:hypothetical protein